MLGDLAHVRFDLGPSLIRREDVQRVGMLTANIEGADLVGTGEAVQAAVEAEIDLAVGYRVTYGGQFEEGARSARTIGLLAGLVLVGMYALLFLAFGNHRHTWIVLVNLLWR